MHKTLQVPLSHQTITCIKFVMSTCISSRNSPNVIFGNYVRSGVCLVLIEKFLSVAMNYLLNAVTVQISPVNQFRTHK